VASSSSARWLIRGASVLLLAVVVVVGLRRRAAEVTVPGMAEPGRSEASPGTVPEAEPRRSLARTCRARLVSESRQPIPRATVFVEGHAAGVSDDSGTFEVGPVPAGDSGVSVDILARGYRPLTAEVPLRTESVPLIVLAPSPIVKGVVVEEETLSPVAGCLLRVKSTDGLEAVSYEIESRPDGTFEVDSIAREGMEVSPRGSWSSRGNHRIQGDGRIPTIPEGKALLGSLDVLYQGYLVLFVRATGSAVITVVDEAQKPVAGAAVRTSELATSSTDARGQVRFEHLPPGEESFTAEAEGFFSQEFTVEIPPRGIGQRQVVLLRGAAVVHGRIVGSAGAPRCVRIEARPERDLEWRSEVLVSVAPSEDGSYELHVPAEQELRLVLWFAPAGAPGRPPWMDREAIRLRRGDRTRRDLRPDAPGVLLVQVVGSSTGRPVEGARVSLEGQPKIFPEERWIGATLERPEDLALSWAVNRSLEEARGFLFTQGTSDARGEVRLYPPAGSWTVSASHSEFLTKTATVDADDRPLLTVRLAVDEGITLRGRLVSTRGEALAGWRVAMGAIAASTTSDNDGRFLFRPVPPGEQGIDVFLPGSDQSQDTRILEEGVVCTPGMPEQEIRVPGVSSIQGRVAVAPPLEAAWGFLEVTRMGPSPRLQQRVALDATGSFRLTPLVAGTYDYELRFRIPSFKDPVSVRKGRVEVAVAEDTWLNLDCPSIAVVNVEVAGEALGKFEYLWLFLDPIGPGVRAVKRLKGEKGESVLVPEGTYRATVRGFINMHSKKPDAELLDQSVRAAAGSDSLLRVPAP
jgi:hypothetical protein